MPAGVVAAPPFAVGRFLNQQHGFVDMSGGNCQLFKVSSLHDIFRASVAMKSTAQFMRRGPMIAAQLGSPPEVPLMKVYVLNLMRSNEQHFIDFGCYL